MNKEILAIITADIHLRETQPRYRVDDYWQAQENAIKFIEKLRHHHACTVLDAGDVFDASAKSNKLNAWAIKNFINSMITIPGNHDLLYHNLKNLDRTNLNVLASAGNICILNNAWLKIVKNNIAIYGIPYTTKLPIIEIPEEYKNYKKILLIHTMVFENSKEYKLNKFIEGFTAKQLLKKYTEFDLIISGHNHKTFEREYENRKLINPGSMMIMKADQKDHKPCIFLLYDDFTTEKVYITQEENIIDDSYLVDIKEKDIRIENFVDNIKLDEEITIDFKQNIENHLIKNETKKPIQNIIWENVK